jgi:hypothetical protein
MTAKKTQNLHLAQPQQTIRYKALAGLYLRHIWLLKK